jgi:hypothetical protein
MRLEARLKALEETFTPRRVPDDGRGAELFAEMCVKARLETQRDQDAEEHLTKDQHKASLYRAIEHANRQAEQQYAKNIYDPAMSEFWLFVAKQNVRALTLEVAELEKADDEREQETA